MHYYKFKCILIAATLAQEGRHQNVMRFAYTNEKPGFIYAEGSSLLGFHTVGQHEDNPAAEAAAIDATIFIKHFPGICDEPEIALAVQGNNAYPLLSQTMSFESAQYPGQFLVHSDSIMKLQQLSEAQNHTQFKLVTPTFIQLL